MKKLIIIPLLLITYSSYGWVAPNTGIEELRELVEDAKLNQRQISDISQPRATLGSNPRILPTFVGTYIFTFSCNTFNAIGTLYVDNGEILSFKGIYSFDGELNTPFESSDLMIKSFNNNLITGDFLIDNQQINFSIKMNSLFSAGLLTGNVRNGSINFTGTVIKD